MRILLVENLSFLPYLKQKGITVFTCSFSEKSDFPVYETKFELSRICIEHSIDVLLQVESLSKRIVIKDISKIDILTAYYAIDVHLNYYWQKHYALLFDIFFCSQKNFTLDHEKVYGQKTYWVPWGVDSEKYFDFIPFKNRKHDISFVGIIDNNRLKRKSILNEIAKRHKLFIAGDTPEKRLNYDEILNIYSNSKIVVNESINNEVNFRFFEATFAGALLFGEEIKNGEEVLFQLENEIVVFNQENMMEKLDFLIENQEYAEKIALNGWKRTRECHTLKNRIERILDVLNNTADSKYSVNTKVKKNDFAKLVKVFFFQTLRVIGDSSYPVFLTDLIRTFPQEDVYDILAKFFLLKSMNSSDAVKYLENKCISNKHELLSLNLLVTVFELGIVENSDEFFQKVLKYASKLHKKGMGYIQGFVNFSNVNIILSGFEAIDFLYSHFKRKAMSHKRLNLLAANILMSANNYQGAIYYLQHNIRYYPDDILTRKYAAKCYFQIYSYELFHAEKLKIMILQREFQLLKDADIDIEIKRISILDLIEHSKDKKLIRDIILGLQELIQD